MLGALILLIGDLERAGALLGFLGIVTVVLASGFLTGPVPAVFSASRRTRHGDLATASTQTQ